MQTKNIHEFDSTLELLGINTNKLGCVMLPCEPFDLFGEGRDQLLDVEDLYHSDNPELNHVAGDVTHKSHITLLYGLMQKAYLPHIKNAVDSVLEGWDRPEYLAPERIDFFPDPRGEGYAAIVIKVDDPHLEEAHARLSYLPHVNTFPRYDPHMTVAYVKLEAAQKWMDVLQKAQFHIYVKDGLDYGHEGD